VGSLLKNNSGQIPLKSSKVRLNSVREVQKHTQLAVFDAPPWPVIFDRSHENPANPPIIEKALQNELGKMFGKVDEKSKIWVNFKSHDEFIKY
jgi:hypothetical protein